MKKLIWRTVFAWVIACVLASGAALAAKSGPELGENEIKLGEEGAAEVAKESKLSDNSADLAHIREIGNKIAAVANRTEIPAVYGSSRITPFKYTFDIIEDKDVNAFSLPGGRIYVYRGLINYVQSDHELAAVIAHEIIHSAHHHMVHLLAKQESLGNQVAIAIIAAMIGGASSADLGNVLLGVQLMQIAKLNGYGMQAERDSDQGAVYLMREAGYNPVGLLTFMERLAKKTALFDYGIYQSHPVDAERVRAAKKLLTEMGVHINRRETTKAAKAEVKMDKVGEADVPGIYINEKLIYRPAPKAQKTSEQLANDTASAINTMLDANLQMYEVKIVPAGGGVVARNQALIVVSEEDAKLMQSTPAEVAKTAGDTIREVIWKQMMDTVH